MIPAHSRSYPILGAALAAKVDPTLAYNLFWFERLAARGEPGAICRHRAAVGAIVALYGCDAWVDLRNRLADAVADGRIYAPELAGRARP